MTALAIAFSFPKCFGGCDAQIDTGPGCELLGTDAVFVGQMAKNTHFHGLRHDEACDDKVRHRGPSPPCNCALPGWSARRDVATLDARKSSGGGRPWQRLADMHVHSK